MSENTRTETAQQSESGGQDFRIHPPIFNLPKGGGAIRGMGEKFAANPATGTGSMTVPIAISPGRSGFGPQISLSYDSGAGNGPFGLGWNLSLPSVTRKTDKGLPRYFDAEESDVFILSGVEDLVPEPQPDGNGGEDTTTAPDYTIHRYRPRIEGLFARIERWTRNSDGDVHWRSVSKDNILSLYGKDSGSRIMDPGDPTRVFNWLICETRDSKGNAVVYDYKPEDGANVDLSQVHERNRGVRNSPLRKANRYPKRIRYGNRLCLLNTSGHRPSFLAQSDIDNADWMFEIVFDYGEGHYQALPTDSEGRERATATTSGSVEWPVRSDPFSSYRAGFEIRTSRLCRRTLMFHHFSTELGVEDCLVRSTEFTYEETPVASLMTAVTQSGFVWGNHQYLKKSMPPLEFEYSKAVIGEEVREVDQAAHENLPYGVDGSAYQWVDLDGEGLPGVITEQGGGWLYKRNESALACDPITDDYSARFAPLEQVTRIPAGNSLAAGKARLMDLAGDGQVDLVEFDRSLAGFYERTDDQQWQPFRAFQSIPAVAWNDPNLKFIDLTGDGHADVLVTEDQVFTWYPSLAEEGFGPVAKVNVPTDEERGPRVVFADGTQTISLADLSGDGLTDIVRIRNGEVCYWPNLGYGRFGAKVAMDNSPTFDRPDQFDPRRIRLADIDGSGVTDILYLGRDQLRFWFNQAGNHWSDAHELPGFPPTDNSASITAVDLLGNGTACLVWSSPLPAARRVPMKYLSLMAKGKPHLLVRTVNNLGAETHIRYAPSTYFYLKDKYDGKPWITKLPFPVHVVERVETYDWISRSRFATRYAYHHGYFDGTEREFRGFGMVEQWDTEEHRGDTDFPDAETVNWDAASWVPPVHTKTWFHTGAFVEAGKISRQYAHEYWVEPTLRGDGPASVAGREALLLPDTVLDDVLTPEETREAYRALKGSVLRIEVYGEDGTARTEHPYTVTEQNFAVRRLQGRGPNRHAVFFTHPREAVTYHYERNPEDPRIGHALTLEVDGFGNVRKSLSIGYGRRQSPLPGEGDKGKQEQILVTYTENDVTNPIVDATLWPDDYLAPLPCETRTYEVTGFSPQAPAARFSFEEFADNNFQALVTLPEIAYEQPADYAQKQKRLIECVRTLYRDDDLSGLLGKGTLKPMALPGETYKLAFTSGLLEQVYVRNGLKLLLPTPADILAGGGADCGGYVDLDGDHRWWIPSGRVFYSPHPDDDAEAELEEARSHFFLPRRYRDPFHTDSASTESLVTFDDYGLLVKSTLDALGNEVTAEHDYRVLQPRLMTDPNGNRTEALFDALGMMAGTAVMGKTAESIGDNLAGFDPDLSPQQLQDFIADPKGQAAVLLGTSTTRIVYDLGRYADAKQPAFAATLAREIHVSELAPGESPKIQISFSYSDGFGREIQKKIQAEPGPVPDRDQDGKIIVGPGGQPMMGGQVIDPRWVGSGWTIFNNKGKPVRQYEPFFTDTHGFEFDVRIGVSPILFYDPLERVVATLHPNHAWEKTVFDPWQQQTWDVNDTIDPEFQWDPGNPNRPPNTGFDPACDRDVGGFFTRLPRETYWPTWYARRVDDAEALKYWPDQDEAGNPIPGNAAIRGREKEAARKTEAHANTPATAHFDSLGRSFLTVAHNRVRCQDHSKDGSDERYETRVEFDIEGNQREVSDAQGRVVMRYDYDLLGNRIHQASMEAGQRWMLNDVAGKPLFAWDSRGHTTRFGYDPLRRPVRIRVTGADPERPGQPLLTERLVYGEQHPEAERLNLRGKPYLHFDQAGLTRNEAHDFKGNLLAGSRRLATDYKNALDWTVVDDDHLALPDDPRAALDLVELETVAAPLLEADTYTSHTRYDALNRPIQLIAPRNETSGGKRNIIQPRYNEANLLDGEDVWLDHPNEPEGLLDAAIVPPSQAGVADIDYDAKGQRQRIAYKNGATTHYAYDPDTFRLTRLATTRGQQAAAECAPLLDPRTCIDPPGLCPRLGSQQCVLQNLSYTYDPAGNITHIQDDAQQTIFFRNKRVEPSNDYTYDAIYRLVEASGREHLGQNGTPKPHSYNDAPRVGIDWSANDGTAMGTYIERYVYDAVGNFLEMQHKRTDAQATDWTRGYTYEEDSQLEDGQQSNRLTRTTVGSTTETYSIDGNGYDDHGNMLNMPHLSRMAWDYKDQLHATARQLANNGGGVETTYYVYDTAGQRVRKITELADGSLKNERVYLGGFEIYRSHVGNEAGLVRETLHIMDDKQRIALVETRTDGNAPTPQPLIRYQHGNHLGSASLELDKWAQIISYEEYTPYGSTSYQAVRNSTETTAKRYRYTGKERDEESGLYYHGARYYVSWLGRWETTDKIIFSKITSNHSLKQLEGSQPDNHKNISYSKTRSNVSTDKDTSKPYVSVAFVDEINLYIYVNNNPINMVDRNGLQGIRNEFLTPRKAEQISEIQEGNNPELRILREKLQEPQLDPMDPLSYKVRGIIIEYMEKSQGDPWFAWARSAMARVKTDFSDPALARAEHYLLRYAHGRYGLFNMSKKQIEFDLLAYHPLRSLACKLNLCKDDPSLLIWEIKGYIHGFQEYKMETASEKVDIEVESEREIRAIRYMLTITKLALYVLDKKETKETLKLLNFSLIYKKLEYELEKREAEDIGLVGSPMKSGGFNIKAK